MLPSLPRGAWLVLGADTLSAVGTGLTLPFLVVYLHDVRDLSLPLAGGAVAILAVASAVGNPLGGWLADRLAPRPTLIAGLLIAALGATAIAGVSSGWEAFGAAALSGLGVGIAWPAQDTLLARLVSLSQRSAVYAVRHATLQQVLAARQTHRTGRPKEDGSQQRPSGCREKGVGAPNGLPAGR